MLNNYHMKTLQSPLSNTEISWISSVDKIELKWSRGLGNVEETENMRVG